MHLYIMMKNSNSIHHLKVPTVLTRLRLEKAPKCNITYDEVKSTDNHSMTVKSTEITKQYSCSK